MSKKVFNGWVRPDFEVKWISLDPEGKDACITLKGLFHKKKWEGMKKGKITVEVDDE